MKPTKDRDPDSLNQLVSLLETLQGLIIVILAGYKRQMQELFDYNDGLRRRFMSMLLFRFHIFHKTLPSSFIGSNGFRHVFSRQL